MKTTRLAIVALLSAALVPTPSLADPPPWAGGGQNGKGKGRNGRDETPDRVRGAHNARPGKHFRDERRVAVRNYYAGEYRAGRCPPGLAKKHNGCMPPGQAKKWEIGRPLPRDVVMYDLPPALVVQIGVPPAGYRYVRIASDILLIAVGTNMVAEAITDLGRR